MSRKVCFFISPLGDEGSAARRRADLVLARIVVPAAETHGYVVVRADQIKTPGMLIFQIWRFLLDAELVIADLTGANLNVHYELGIRHAITKPVLQLAERGEMLAFDVAGVRTVFIDTRTADG